MVAKSSTFLFNFIINTKEKNVKYLCNQKPDILIFTEQEAFEKDNLIK